MENAITDYDDQFLRHSLWSAQSNLNSVYNEIQISEMPEAMAGLSEKTKKEVAEYLGSIEFLITRIKNSPCLLPDSKNKPTT
jgi:hypothetical protein